MDAETVVTACYIADNFPNSFCDLLERNGSDATEPFAITSVRDIYVNVNSQKTSGVDLTLRYERGFNFGDITFEGQATYTDTDTLQLFDTAEESGFDVEDFNDPIKIDILDDLGFTIDPNLAKYFNIRISQDQAVDDIGRYPFYPKKEYKYYSVQGTSRDHKTINTTTNMFAAVSLRLSSKYTKIERRNYKIEELISELGGVIEILVLVGAFIVGKFSDKLYTSDVIRDMYFVKPDNN